MGDTRQFDKLNPYAGYIDVLPAKRLANLIGTIRTVLMVLVAVGAVLGLLTYSDLALVVVLYAIVSIVTIYVTFGWLEQTLRLLVGIAYNTAESADLMADVEPGPEHPA